MCARTERERGGGGEGRWGGGGEGIHAYRERDNGVKKADDYLGQMETGGSGKGDGEGERERHACTEFAAHEKKKNVVSSCMAQE